jgi:hypothetical protein
MTIAPSRARRFAAVLFALVAGLLLVPFASKAGAASCAGRHATIVGTAGDDVLDGKRASDVI